MKEFPIGFKFKLITLIYLAVLCFAVPSYAMDEHGPFTHVTITPESNKVEAGQSLIMAITIDLAEHWHVYWANPGDSGLPVSVEWESGQDIEVKDIKWPIPDKINTDFLSNYGYYDQVTLLQPITFPENIAEGKIELRAKVNMLVCNEICIPESQSVVVTLNDPLAFKKDNGAYIEEAGKFLPETLEGDFSYREKDGFLLVKLALEDSERINLEGQNLEFFPLDRGMINHAAEPKVYEEEEVIWIVHDRGDQALPLKDNLIGLLAIKGQKYTEGAYEIKLHRDDAMEYKITLPTKEQPILVENIQDDYIQPDQITLISAIIFALIGGLILNLMPCVFPVLSMKALSLVKIAEKEASLARKHGLAYTAGIMGSFIVIAGVLLMFKSAGLLVGWGFQLQNPVIVGALAYLFFLITLNLMGFIEISSRFGGLGQSLSQKAGLSGTFFTGVLAAVVATPCTAPFMAAAIGFALVQPALISLSVFAALGFGLAFPYLFLCYVPAACKILPRPGPWMEGFRKFLALPMFASSLWLIWVLSAQKGAVGVLYILSGMLFIVLSIRIAKITASKPALKHVRNGAFVIALLMPFLSLMGVNNAPVQSINTARNYEFGEKFSAQALETALAAQHPVFVEMTASWCITCKLNHAVAINIASTKKLFEEKKIRYFIGDWTNYDGEITEYLESFGRNGVPIYVYYPPKDKVTGQRSGAVLLPQLLTPKTLQEALGD
ncbi:MAG: protein-disulfide reductase DsbD family protein [Alphaproteobacteria bacterium]|nr:protein-disulfide reductase DsbD family protein [Alphaproteobacteria bacterium]